MAPNFDASEYETDEVEGSLVDASCVDDAWPEIRAGELTWMEQIGAGHTSEVFKGTFRGQMVAIKQFVQGGGKGEDEMLAREVAIMCLVRQDHIVRLHGVVISSRAPPQIIMEYCAGGSAFDVIHRTSGYKISWSQRLKMCKHVAIAMDYLHKFTPCIIHRDLKSLNILLDQPLRSAKDVPLAKVADFGLARVLDVVQKMTVGVGTGRWMAPEMLSRQKQYDEKVDVYSYAMFLYEVICSSIPFEHDHPMDMKKQVLDGVRPDLSNIMVECPPSMHALIVQCWAGDARKRPSFEDVIEVLKNAGRTVVVLSL